jgi:hypothetical protein
MIPHNKQLEVMNEPNIVYMKNTIDFEINVDV